MRTVKTDKSGHLRSFCWFCHAVAQMSLLRCFKVLLSKVTNEPLHDKTNKMACVPSEDSYQPGHPPSLIRVFAVRLKKAWVLSYPLSA